MAPTLALSAAAAVLLLIPAFSGSVDAAVVVKRQDPPINDLPTNWEYNGCYTDNIESRTLASTSYFSETGMTAQSCIQFCGTRGYKFAGTEYSAECFCGNWVGSDSSLRRDAECNMACSGDETQQCGGPGRITILENTAIPSPKKPTANPGPPDDWVYVGCYSEGNGGRVLSDVGIVRGGGENMTVANCADACFADLFTLAGVEFGGECWCGNEFLNDGGPDLDKEKKCNMPCNGNMTELCGGPNRLNMYDRSGTVVPITYTHSTTTTASATSGTSSSSAVITSSDAPSPTSSAVPSPSASFVWSHLGCYTDSVAARTLEFNVGVDGPVTWEACQSSCEANGFTYAGVEYSAECWCDNEILNDGREAPDGDAQCNMPCAGDAEQICGGPDRMNLFKWGPLGGGASSSSAASSASTSASASSTASSSSADISSLSTVSSASVSSLSTVPSASVSFLSTASSASVSSLSTVSSASVSSSSSSSSSVPSSTSSATSSGSSMLSSIVSSPTPSPSAGWSYLGCYTDSPGRTLTQGMTFTGDLTIEKCQDACQAAGYIYAGTEYANECFCGNTFANEGGPAPDGEVGCNMLCGGNPAQTCGGPFRLSVYGYTGGPVSSASSSVIVSSSISSGVPSSVSSASASPSPTPSGLPAGWDYEHCYVDNAFGRIMRYQQPDSQQLTVESCVNICVTKGYTVAGMQYSAQCFCDDFIVNGGEEAPETQCNMPCSGDSTQKCGGPARMSVYSKGAVKALPVPGSQKTGLPGSWEWGGCITDPGLPVRTFKYQIIFKDTNSAETCLTRCQEYGYGAAGMEYGEECFCGDNRDVIDHGAELRPDTECNALCPGNASYYCGAGNRLSYYKWTGTPLDSWHTPTGWQAGEYQFLVGGVVIPLISTPGVNGKVSFLEKKGTGPPNSTGAYELDLQTLTHRELHLKTDVFCAAGLTLPDRAGRQINVGGWSGDSTFGVRLYWPDGSPGVEGTNDYEEDVNYLSLQKGRWYPTAMMMANGSILVMGGQVGSNGAPVPSLELLPRVGGVIHCDYLERTDPWNLYPYLAVLPSGGIFVSYFNEALIIDEVSLQPTTMLPKLPGAVHNEKGGRTYPLEGTMMVMPQHAPYTDPLTVLICGGSTPFQGDAIDNCISLQPESPAQNWTLERMPSPRVMSCITALPDGTYLILNGAKQGEAGFGLADIPNFNAVLYDPTKPLHQRMSIMANTTIARMYHSEAVLLQDGRVLISGSDPQDPDFPQEYRLEVFMPPYLLSGFPRPQFTIQEKDWTYGGTYTITVTAGSVDRVSLMGAESSTHGATMGQRTFFPAAACAGNTCTITAPPNAHVCPPGWFQVFVLDGPTPSHSIWVRIGGDPGNLGEWPDAPGFNPPGPGPLVETF